MHVPKEIVHLILDLDGVLTQGERFSHRLLREVAERANEGVFVSFVTARGAKSFKEKIIPLLKKNGITNQGLQNAQFLAEDGRVVLDLVRRKSVLAKSVEGHPLADPEMISRLEDEARKIGGVTVELPRRQTAVSIRLNAGLLRDNPSEADKAVNATRKILEDLGLSKHVDLAFSRSSWMVVPASRGKVLGKSFGANTALALVAEKTGLDRESLAGMSLVVGDQPRDLEMSRPSRKTRIPAYFSGFKDAYLQLRPAQSRVLVATSLGRKPAVEAKSVFGFLEYLKRQRILRPAPRRER